MQRTKKRTKLIIFSSLFAIICIFPTNLLSVSATDEYESNDELLSATLVEIGTTYVVELVPDDVDYFRYTWPQKFSGKEIILYISVEVDPIYENNWLPLKYWVQDSQGTWSSTQSSYMLFSALKEEYRIEMDQVGKPDDYCFSIAHRTSGSDSFLINTYSLAIVTFRIWKSPPSLGTILIFSFAGVGVFVFIRYKKKKSTSQKVEKNPEKE